MLHVGNARIAERAEIDGGVVVADVVHRAGRHGDAGAEVFVGVPSEVRELEAEFAFAVDAIEHAHSGVDHFGTNAVAGNDGDSFRHAGADYTFGVTSSMPRAAMASRKFGSQSARVSASHS